MSHHRKRQPWTPAEDQALQSLVEAHGSKQWAVLADRLQVDFCLNGRSGKQCRERWRNHLDPGVVKRPWLPEEDEVLFQAHVKVGNRWAYISRLIPGRSENDIKNRFYSTSRSHRLERESSALSVTEEGRPVPAMKEDWHDLLAIQGDEALVSVNSYKLGYVAFRLDEK